MNQSNILRLSFALCMITTAVNLQAPLYDALATREGLGVGATTVAFACYVAGILPVLLALSGLADRMGRRPLIGGALCLCLLATSLTILVPGLVALGVARFLMGVATALTSSVAPTYMLELYMGKDQRIPATWVTASTSLGFGLGAAVTSLFILQEPSLTPPSLWLYLGAGSLALLLVLSLQDDAPRQQGSAMLRLPAYPAGTFPFGLSILLAWATVGLVIAVLPSTLAKHGLAAWSGFATFGVCSCGVLFQPLARKLSPYSSTQFGLIILPLAYVLIAWGSLGGILAAVLLGTVVASSACYGFIYLGGLSGVLEVAGSNKMQASAGFFLMAYIGFSLPVIMTGVLVDVIGHTLALTSFGGILVIGSIGASMSLGITRNSWRRHVSDAKR